MGCWQGLAEHTIHVHRHMCLKHDLSPKPTLNLSNKLFGHHFCCFLYRGEQGYFSIKEINKLIKSLVFGSINSNHIFKYWKFPVDQTVSVDGSPYTQLTLLISYTRTVRKLITSQIAMWGYKPDVSNSKSCFQYAKKKIWTLLSVGQLKGNIDLSKSRCFSARHATIVNPLVHRTLNSKKSGVRTQNLWAFRFLFFRTLHVSQPTLSCYLYVSTDYNEAYPDVFKQQSVFLRQYIFISLIQIHRDRDTWNMCWSASSRELI